MTWFRVDDTFYSHPKVIAAGNAATGLWIRGGTWCAQHLTDGHITTESARSLGTRKEINRLVEVGLWIEEPGGYEFHAWKPGERQPTADEVKERHARTSDERRKAGTKGASKRWQTDSKTMANADVSDGKPMANANGKRIAPARPDPAFVNGLGSQGGKPPTPTCHKHPHGTDQPCKACGDARRAHDTWLIAEHNKPTPTPQPYQPEPVEPGDPKAGLALVKAAIHGGDDAA